MAEPTNGNGGPKWQNIAIWAISGMTIVGGYVWRDAAARLDSVAARVEKMDDKQREQEAAIVRLEEREAARERIQGLAESISQLKDTITSLQQQQSPRVRPQGTTLGTARFDK